MSAESVAAEKLAGYFLEWDLIEDEKKALADRSKALFKAMKDEGYDTKAARVSFREKRVELLASPEDVSKAEADEATLDLYRVALTNGLRSRARPAHTRESTTPKASDAKVYKTETVDLSTTYRDTQEQPETETESGRTAQVRGEGKVALLPAGTADEARSTPAASVSDAIARKDHQSVRSSSPDGSASTESAAGKVSDPAQPSPPKQVEPETAGEGAPPLSPAILSDEEVVPAFMRKEYVRKTARDYRPHCQHPDVCPASGLDHCYYCKKALATAEAEPA